MSLNKPTGPKEIRQIPETRSLSSLTAMQNSLRKSILRILMLTASFAPIINCSGQINNKDSVKEASKEVSADKEMKNFMSTNYGIPHIDHNYNVENKTVNMDLSFNPVPKEGMPAVIEFSINYSCANSGGQSCAGTKTFKIERGDPILFDGLVKGMPDTTRLKVEYKFKFKNGEEKSYSDLIISYDDEHKQHSRLQFQE